tara:strand:- start:76 stop:414 length:339 start_codon:yes stop_codon:yes gene_type:complete
MSKNKYTIIWTNGYFLTHETWPKLNLETLQTIIGTKVVEGTQGRWDGQDMAVMYVDENACFKKDLAVNMKATQAYQEYWGMYQKEYGTTGYSVDMEKVKNTKVKGTVILKWK